MTLWQTHQDFHRINLNWKKPKSKLSKPKSNPEIEKARTEQETPWWKNNFDLSQQVRLIPAFNEVNVDKYFQHFGKIASNLKWPIEAGPMLIQTALRGKAQDIYASLLITDCADYNLVRQPSSGAEMVPEDYREKFRAYQKEEKQTYQEFFCQKEIYFDRWSSAKVVGSNQDKLRWLILMEEFKRMCPWESWGVPQWEAYRHRIQYGHLHRWIYTNTQAKQT